MTTATQSRSVNERKGRSRRFRSYMFMLLYSCCTVYSFGGNGSPFELEKLVSKRILHEILPGASCYRKIMRPGLYTL